MARHQPAPIGEVLQALCTGPYLTGLADLAEGSPVGRRRAHPTWVPFAYGALCRHFRSANRLDSELRAGLWDQLRTAAEATGLDDPGPRPYRYPQHSYWRARLVDDPDVLGELHTAFTQLALTQARHLGLLRPDGPGSLTHPALERVIYGDGTVVRPIYRRPPTKVLVDPDTGQKRRYFIDRTTGEILDKPQGRYDASAEDFHRHDGPIHGNNFVMVCARGTRPGQRVVLGIDRVTGPSREAETAVALIQRIAVAAGPGIQAVVYDGAFNGVHIDQLMRGAGLVVINRIAYATRGDDTGTAPVTKRKPLGIYHHDIDGQRCTHTLHTDNGTIVDVTLADDGTPTIVGRTRHKQVKRSQRADGTYRFNLAVTVPCPHGEFTIWVSPHPTKARDTTPEHVRLVPPEDPDFAALYGRRNDAESINSQFKRTLLVDRAVSVGWQRQLFDLLAFAILENSLSHARHQGARHLHAVA